MELDPREEGIFDESSLCMSPEVSSCMEARGIYMSSNNGMWNVPLLGNVEYRTIL